MAKITFQKPEPKIDDTVPQHERRFGKNNTHFVLLYRRILDNDQYKSLSLVGKNLYITSILMANYRDAKFEKTTYRGQTITVHLKRGQFLTSWKQMTEIANGLPPRTITHNSANKANILKLVRKYRYRDSRGGLVTKDKIVGISEVRRAFGDMAQECLVELKSGEIGTIVTVCNYNTYQDLDSVKTIMDTRYRDVEFSPTHTNSLAHSSQLIDSEYADTCANTVDANEVVDNFAVGYSNGIVGAVTWAREKINASGLFRTTHTFNATAMKKIANHVNEWGIEDFKDIVRMAIVYAECVTEERTQDIEIFAASNASLVINKMMDWANRAENHFGDRIYEKLGPLFDTPESLACQ